VEVDLWVRCEEVFDGIALVSREIVGKHVDLFSVGLIDDDVGEEGDKLSGGVPLGGLTESH
jgi:hypothetical protein